MKLQSIDGAGSRSGRAIIATPIARQQASTAAFAPKLEESRRWDLPASRGATVPIAGVVLTTIRHAGRPHGHEFRGRFAFQ
jgi:hypothetical protein